MSDAGAEGSGWNPRQYASGAPNVAGRNGSPCTEVVGGLMEKILSRPNMLAALERVVSNKGAPGVDGMPVGALIGYVTQH